MKIQSSLIVTIIIALAVAITTASAYFYADSQYSLIAYNQQTKAVTTLQNLQSMRAKRVVSGNRTASFVNLEDINFTAEPFEFTRTFDYQRSNNALHVIDSEGLITSFEPDTAVNNEVFMSDSEGWINLIDGKNVTISEDDSITTIQARNVGVLSEGFKTIYEESLIRELESTFTGFEVTETNTDINVTFTITITLQNKTLQSITIAASEPIVVGFKLQSLEDGNAAIQLDTLEGSVTYSDVQLVYDFEFVELDPELPSNALEVLFYDLFIY